MHKTDPQLIARIRQRHREREDIHQSEKKLSQRLYSIARRMADGDDAETKRIYAAVNKNRLDTLAPDELLLLERSCVPLLESRAVLERSRLDLEKELCALAKQLHVWPWVEQVRGVGPLSLAQVVGEAGDLSAEKFAKVSCLWKRFGVGLVDGERQRRVAGNPDLAIIHGYSAKRRSVLYCIGENFVRCGGAYRLMYDHRKQFEIEKAEAEGLEVRPAAKIGKGDKSDCRSQGHVANRARRWVEKRFLKDLWMVWRHGAPTELTAGLVADQS